MNAAVWAALTIILTVLGLAWTWWAYRRGGLAKALRVFAVTLLPAAAWLTGSLEMLTEVAASLGDWATSLVFDVRTWVGVGLFGLAAVLWFVSGLLIDRRLAGASTPRAPKSQAPRPSQLASPGAATGTPAAASGGDDLDDIEALLRKRGIE